MGSTSVDTAAALALGRKIRMASKDDRALSLEDIQAVLFTYEGFGAWNAQLSHSACKLTGQRITPQVLSWTWAPIKNSPGR